MPRANCSGGTLHPGVTNARATSQAPPHPSTRPLATIDERWIRITLCSGVVGIWVALVHVVRALPNLVLRVVPVRLTVYLTVASLMTLHAVAHGAEPQLETNGFEPVELRWIRLEGAEQCPPRAAFEAALQKRLGKTSFTSRGSRVLTVTLSNEKGPFRSVLSLEARASEAVESKQELFSYSSHCEEVFNATVLSVALLLNPDEMEDPSEDPALEDSDFFDSPTGGLAVPASDPDGRSTRGSQTGSAHTTEIPVAPRPWVRENGAIAGALAVGLEQLPSPALGFSARSEWPVARTWLLWVGADWLHANPGEEAGVGVAVTQSSGWVGGAWLPYDNQLFEFHLLGGLGVRQLTATLTDSDPRYHLALQLGVGLVLEISKQFALDTRASAVVPLRTEFLGSSWTQPAIGGQLQIGAIVGIPNPPAPN